MATQLGMYKYKATKYFKTTTHYTLQNRPDNLLLSKDLNIAESRNFAKSKPLFWCQEREDKKWITPRLTGLFKTSKGNVYWGCRGRFKHLIIFHFKNNREELNIYYFNNYFTRNLNPLITNL